MSTRETATTWAICPDCETLHVGFTGHSVCCAHSTIDGVKVTTIKAQRALRVRDGGFRYDPEPSSPAERLALVEALAAGVPEMGIPPLIDKATAVRLLDVGDDYWSAEYPRKGMTE